jgi:hypothetical protein
MFGLLSVRIKQLRTTGSLQNCEYIIFTKIIEGRFFSPTSVFSVDNRQMVSGLILKKYSTPTQILLWLW